jgi:hypothetical protein
METQNTPQPARRLESSEFFYLQNLNQRQPSEGQMAGDERTRVQMFLSVRNGPGSSKIHCSNKHILGQ